MSRELMLFRRTLVVVLSLPILAFGIFVDVIKFPLLLFIIWPIWGFIDLLEVLKGNESMFLEMVWESAFMGILMWWEIVS